MVSAIMRISHPVASAASFGKIEKQVVHWAKKIVITWRNHLTQIRLVRIVDTGLVSASV